MCDCNPEVGRKCLLHGKDNPHTTGCLDLDDTHRGVCRTSPAPTPDFTVEVINGAVWIFTDAASISLTRAQAVAVGVAGASVGAA